MTEHSQEAVSNSTLIFGIISVIFTIIGLLVTWFIKSTVTELKTNGLSNAISSQQLSKLSSDISDIKKGLDDFKDIKTDLAVIKNIVNSMKENENELRKMTYENQKSITKIKDDILHIYKEMKQ